MNDLFYTNIDKNKIDLCLFELLEKRAQENKEMTYILDKPLLETGQEGYSDGILILIRGYKLILLSTTNDERGFEYFCEDVQEDIAYFSTKFEYKNKIGRPREWWSEIVVPKFDYNVKNFSEFIDECKIENPTLVRKTNLIYGLLIGAINDNISCLEIEQPVNILSAIKNKIMLFDGDQTNFIFNKDTKRQILIQGLAGTGKTELLLHKIRELYTEKNSNKICLTCFNKVLAKELKKRVPIFFNSMKVDEQIAWNERLFLFSSWGSSYDCYSGLYSYLCKKYNAVFEPWGYSVEFGEVCKRLLSYLNELENFEPCIDYLLIDEVQDFTDDFLNLCEKIAGKTVYIAMDIYQNIFTPNDKSFKIKPDYTLSKCYRTDPKTLMISHSMGLALFENKPRLGWLNKEGWEICGYKCEFNNNMAKLSRYPINRFDDEGFINDDSIVIIPIKENDIASKMIKIIEQLKEKYINIKPSDIAIIFLEGANKNYELADKIEYMINSHFDWEVSNGYKSKEKKENHIYITNINNVKGLEFPFVICYSTGGLPKSFKNRNSLYMILTRSFITSYFIISEENMDFYNIYNHQIELLKEQEFLEVEIPDDSEKTHMRKIIIDSENANKTLKERVEDYLKQKNISYNDFYKYHSFLKQNFSEEYDFEIIKSKIDGLYLLLEGQRI